MGSIQYFPVSPPSSVAHFSVWFPRKKQKLKTSFVAQKVLSFYFLRNQTGSLRKREGSNLPPSPLRCSLLRLISEKKNNSKPALLYTNCLSFYFPGSQTGFTTDQTLKASIFESHALDDVMESRLDGHDLTIIVRSGQSFGLDGSYLHPCTHECHVRQEL